MMQGQAPLIGRGNNVFEKLGVQEIANQMFDSRCMLSDAGDISLHGKILTASCLFRGKSLSALEVESTIAKFKNKKSTSFVEWIPDNMMNSICKTPAAWNETCDISGTFLCNSTCITNSFENICGSFDKMLKAKAFVHWYTAEGMDIEEFKMASSNMRDLISEYQQYQDADSND
jgi:tubulin beta